MGERKTWPRTRLALLAAGIVSAILSVFLIVVAIRLSPHIFAPEFEGDPGVGLATAGLALFTGLLFLAAAITAFFAYEQISTSTAVNSADLALQLDNRFTSEVREDDGLLSWFPGDVLCADCIRAGMWV